MTDSSFGRKAGATDIADYKVPETAVAVDNKNEDDDVSEADDNIEEDDNVSEADDNIEEDDNVSEAAVIDDNVEEDDKVSEAAAFVENIEEDDKVSEAAVIDDNVEEDDNVSEAAAIDDIDEDNDVVDTATVEDNHNHHDVNNIQYISSPIFYCNISLFNHHPCGIYSNKQMEHYLLSCVRPGISYDCSTGNVIKQVATDQVIRSNFACEGNSDLGCFDL